MTRFASRMRRRWNTNYRAEVEHIRFRVVLDIFSFCIFIRTCSHPRRSLLVESEMENFSVALSKSLPIASNTFLYSQHIRSIEHDNRLDSLPTFHRMNRLLEILKLEHLRNPIDREPTRLVLADEEGEKLGRVRVALGDSDVRFRSADVRVDIEWRSMAWSWCTDAVYTKDEMSE